MPPRSSLPVTKESPDHDDLKVAYGEHELVFLLQQKYEPSFNYLYDHYSGALYGMLLQIIPDREVATDLLQEVFVKIWQNIGTYDPSKGRIFTWMLTVARNSAIDMRRSRRYQDSRKTDGMPDKGYLERDGMATYLNVNHIGLKKMVEILRPKDRILIDLAFFKGYTNTEIAKMQNLPLGTVKTGISRALNHLRVYLNQRSG